MKYLLLIHYDEQLAARRTEAEQAQVTQAYMDYSRRIRKEGQYLAAEALQPVATATTVRVKDGRTVTTDGPFAETREQLGGFFLVDAKDLDEAIGLAAGIPGAKWGAIEVRPIRPTPQPD